MAQRDQATKAPDRGAEKPAKQEDTLQATPVLLQRAYAAPNTLSPNDVQNLQRTVGNRATVEIVSRALPLQAKMRRSFVDDPLEHDTEPVVERVVRQITAPPVQRNEDEEERRRATLPTATDVVTAAPQQVQAKSQFVAQRQEQVAPVATVAPQPKPSARRPFVVQRRYNGSVLDHDALKKDKKGGDGKPSISGFTKKGRGTSLSDLIKGMYTLILRDDVTIDQLRTQLGLVRNAFVADKQTIQDAGSATAQQKTRAGTVFDKWIKVVDDNLAHLNTPLSDTVTEDKLITDLRRAYNDNGGIKPGDDLPQVADMLEVRFENRQKKQQEQAAHVRQVEVGQHFDENVGAILVQKIRDLEFLTSLLPQLPEPIRSPDLPQKLKDLAEPLVVQAVDEEKSYTDISTDVQKVTKAADPKPGMAVIAAKFFTAARSVAMDASEQAIAPVAAPAKDAATEAQEFLQSREIYKISADEMSKEERTAFSAALRKVSIIKQLLTPDAVPEEEVVVATWKDNKNLQDDVRSEKEDNKDVAPDLLDAMRRKAAEANDFFKRFVAPQFLATISPPIVKVHAKPAQSLLSPKGFRAFQSDNFIHVAQNEDMSIIVHEVGHYVENNLPPEAWMDIRDLINKRHAAAGGGAKADTGDTIFTRDEGRFKGNYPATGKYTSRAYADEGSTEMTSMTLEYLSDPRKINTMIDKDPQQAAIIIRALNPDAYNAVPDLVNFAKYLPNPTRRRARGIAPPPME